MRITHRCRKCKVNVNGEICPLCKAKTDDIENSSADYSCNYPKYPKNRKSWREILKKSTIFITVSLTLISVFINIFTYEKADNLWSIIVSGAMCLALVSVIQIISKQTYIGRKILCIYVCISIFLVVIDILYGFTKWSTNYVVPFMNIAVAIYFTFNAVLRKNRFSDYFGYLIFVFVLSFIPILYYIFGLSDRLWSSLVASLSCVIIAFGLWIFADKKLKNELKKIFHY